MSRRNQPGIHTQPMQAKDICILLVNDDHVCQNIVANMLNHCRYEAFSYEKEMDAVNMIWEKKDVTELILTNVHRTYAKRHGIIEHIEEKIKLQIIFGGKGVTVYFMKSLSVNEMNNLWATALTREKNKRELSSEKLLHKENAGSRRMVDDNEQQGNIEKKPRVVWTKEMHHKFLAAIAQLGDEKAFPKKIVELMNVPGLTRANVASHLQKHRLCMKRAQEGFSSSYDFTDNFGFNTSRRNFQQSHWNPFQMRSRNNTIMHSSFNYYKSRSIIPQRLSLLKTIQLKPEHNFSIYGDETKNILLRSTDDSRVHPNTSFAGLRFARDGKSVVFGQNNHLASSVQQQLSFPEIKNDDSTHCPPVSASLTPQESLVAPPEAGGEPSFSSQLSSLSALLAVDEPMPAIMTQPQPSAAPIGLDWNKEATQPPSSVDSPLFDWDEPLSFTCQQQQPQPQPQPLAVMTPPQSAGPQWTDWAELPSFSPQQPLSGNTANANSDIFSDFTSTPLPPEFCQLGEVGDDSILDATAMSVFDDLVFDNYELT